MDGQLKKDSMSQRRKNAIRRLQESENIPRRFLRLRKTLALIGWLINLVIWMPMFVLLLILLVAFVSGGASFVQDVIATKGVAMYGKGFPVIGGIFLVTFSAALGLVLGMGVFYPWLVVKTQLLSEDEAQEFLWRIDRGGIIFGWFLKKPEKPTRHEFRN